MASPPKPTASDQALGSKTPPKPGNLPGEIKSTPMNAGTAAVAEYRPNTHVKHVTPQVLEALKTVSSTDYDTLLLTSLQMLGLSKVDADEALDSLLQHATDLCNAHKIQRPNKATKKLKAESKKLRAALKKYCTRTNDDRYEPLVEALDAILDASKDLNLSSEALSEHSTTDLRFQVNDPRMIMALHTLSSLNLVSKRSPDIIALSASIANAFAASPAWPDVLNYFELKFFKIIKTSLLDVYLADRCHETGISPMSVDLEAHQQGLLKRNLGSLESRLSLPESSAASVTPVTASTSTQPAPIITTRRSDRLKSVGESTGSLAPPAIIKSSNSKKRSVPNDSANTGSNK
ncbi:hypothetical protein C8J56DRAFT_1126698 [Mycena floridula]|nr:hypothetical protein C8J56DRAFT_1126698 [Mycena floridula]